MATSTAKPETTESKPVKRSLWKRLLIRLVLLLLLVAIGGVGFLYYRSNRLITSEPYQAALKYVTKSKILKDKVGEPLTSAGFFEDIRNGFRSSVPEEDKNCEAQIQFKLLSPKGLIAVAGQGRKRDGNWAIQDLSVEIPGEKERVSLNTEVEVDTAKDTPLFDPNKQEKIDVNNLKLSKPDEIKFEDIPMPPM